MAAPSVPRLDRRTIAFKVETVYGQDAFGGTVVTGDIQEAYNIEANVGPQIQDVPFMGGYLGTLGTVPGVRLAQVTFEQMARGAGAAYSASVVPNVDLPFRGCGMQSTLVAGTSVTYKPRSSGFEAMTIYVMQENAPTVKLLGAFGDFAMTSGVGRWMGVRYTFTGIYEQETDLPVLVTRAFSPSPQWPVMLSSALQIGTEDYGPCVATVGLTLNNSMDVQECANAESGVAGVFIGGRRPQGALDPEQNTRAVFDWIAKWEESQVMDLTYQSNGVALARWKVNVPKTTIRTRPWGRRGQKATYNVAFDCIPTVGDDEFSIIFD